MSFKMLILTSLLIFSAALEAAPRTPTPRPKATSKKIMKAKVSPPRRSTPRTPSGMPGMLSVAAGASQALEIRGQARTLSMMLILRNGKENVNFVKVRQNYATEIANTEF